MNLHLTLFQDLIALCRELSPDQYTFGCAQLSRVSIGEHLRHSIEFYDCLKKGISIGEVNYDGRERDTKLQTDPIYAISVIEELSLFFLGIEENRSLALHTKDSALKVISSSVAREMLYCLDHAIHHQALIKIGLKEMQLGHLVPPEFGVAYSTLRFRTKT